MREEAFFHASEEDERELEALGGVEGHEGDAGLGGVLVGVRDEGGVVEEVSKRFAARGGVLGSVGEFLEVLDAGEGLGRAFVLEGADVAGAVVEKFDEFGEGGGIAGFAEGVGRSGVGDCSSLGAAFLRAAAWACWRLEMALDLRTTGASRVEAGGVCGFCVDAVCGVRIRC